jgi:hypothetical protein
MRPFALSLLLLACASERPACSPAALAALETAYATEVFSTCDGYDTPEQCPDYPAIKARFAAKREAWVSCR